MKLLTFLILLVGGIARADFCADVAAGKMVDEDGNPTVGADQYFLCEAEDGAKWVDHNKTPCIEGQAPFSEDSADGWTHTEICGVKKGEVRITQHRKPLNPMLAKTVTTVIDNNVADGQFTIWDSRDMHGHHKKVAEGNEKNGKVTYTFKDQAFWDEHAKENNE
jgi:hypothetical protein